MGLLLYAARPAGERASRLPAPAQDRSVCGNTRTGELFCYRNRVSVADVHIVTDYILTALVIC